MRLFEEQWTPESADRWTRHDVIASILSAFSYFALALGSLWAIVGRASGYWLMASAVGASLTLWAVVDKKLKAQSKAFEAREQEHSDAVEDRQRWEG
jgi:hypothetical protein